MDSKIERCGYCGSYFSGNAYLTIEELKGTPKEIIDKAPLGYCPNAQRESGEYDEPQRYITRDMAIDAGDPSLEGQPYNF